MGLAVLVPVDSSVAGDWTKVVAVLCRCCAGRILLGGVPGHPCERRWYMVHVDVASWSWMRALVSLGWSTPSDALTAQQGVRTRFIGRSVIVTGATVSTSLLLYTAVGDWAWMRRCRSSMKLRRPAASPHCPGVDSVAWYCTYLDPLARHSRG